mmetsp:Transcript_71745/g.149801  ORF Transcript_71745/g.149801 Transcript_71745/m.149801 type:complete len:215 (-) Transcript_71745:669-1313(-)
MARELLASGTRRLVGGLDALVDALLELLLQALVEVLVHRAPATEHDLVVQPAACVDGARLDRIIDERREGDQVVGAVHLGAEEYLGREESLVADIALPGLLGDGVDGVVLLDPLVRLGIVLAVLLDDVWAHVAVRFLDFLGSLEGLLGGDGLASLAHQVLHKRRHVAPCDRHALDAGPDHISLCHGDHVRYAVPRVHHRPRKGLAGTFLYPGGS